MALTQRTPRVSWIDKNGVARSFTFTGNDYTSYAPQWEGVENEFENPFTGVRTRDFKGSYLTASIGISAAAFTTRDTFAWGGLLNTGNTLIRFSPHSARTENIYTVCSSATSTTIVVSGIVATVDQYKDTYIKIPSGTGANQSRSVVSNAATSSGLTSFTVATWTTTPDATSAVIINAVGGEVYPVDMGRSFGYRDFLGNYGQDMTLQFRSKQRYEQPINPPDGTWGSRTLDFTAPFHCDGSAH